VRFHFVGTKIANRFLAWKSKPDLRQIKFTHVPGYRLCLLSPLVVAAALANNARRRASDRCPLDVRSWGQGITRGYGTPICASRDASATLRGSFARCVVTDTSRDSAAIFASSTMQAHWHAPQRAQSRRNPTPSRRHPLRCASVRSQTRQQGHFHTAVSGKDIKRKQPFWMVFFACAVLENLKTR
jgi:hypothetical protein